MNQSRVDSALEAAVNTGVGFLLAWGVWSVLIWAMSLPIGHGESAFITAMFTVVSIIRSYIIRRLFNGRSIGAALLARKP